MTTKVTGGRVTAKVPWYVIRKEIRNSCYKRLVLPPPSNLCYCLLEWSKKFKHAVFYTDK